MFHRKKIISVLFALSLQSNFAIAGLYELTVHSRANCINNESISWHADHEYMLSTSAEHHLFKPDEGTRFIHTVESGWEKTWRSAAVHWGEAPLGVALPWMVVGKHSMMLGMTQYIIGYTTVTDCSIYDGWWD